MSNITRRVALSLAAFATFSLVLNGRQDAHGDTITWDDGFSASGDWTNTNQWVGGVVPVAGDTARFTWAASGNRTINIPAGNQPIDAIVIDGGQNFSNYTFSGAGTFLLSDGGSISKDPNGGSQTFSVQVPVVILGDGGSASFLHNTGGSTNNGTHIIGGVTGSSTIGNTTTVFFGGSQTGNSAGFFNQISNIGDGTLGGNVEIVKTGPSTWRILGSNTYTGDTSVLAGTLLVGANAPDSANGALGNASSAILVGNSSGTDNASLIINQGTFTIGRDITVQAGSSGTATLGAISTTTTSTFSGDVALNKSIQVTSSSNPSNTVNFSGTISDGGGGFGLTKIGGGFVTLSNQNTYTGVTAINQGVLRVGSAENVGVSGPLGTSAAVNPGSITFGGGYLQYSAANQFDYSGRFSTAAGQLYKVELNNQNITWASNLTSGGASSLTVAGAGFFSGPRTALTLTGINTIGTGGIIVGQNPSPSGDLSGSLLISSGSTGTTGTLNIGQGANALGLVQVTGSGNLSAATTIVSNSTREAALRLSSGSISAGTLSANNGRGLIAVDGGTFTYTTLNLNSAGGAPSVFDVSGGSVTGGQANIGSANARTGMVTVRDGTFTPTGMKLGSNNIAGTLVMSEGGTLDLGTANLVISGGNGSTARFGTANLVGGTVSAGGIIKSESGTLDSLTFSGGTLQATQNTATFVQGLSSANVYVGGAAIDTQAFDVTVAQVLQGTSGNGITSIAVDAGGSGYLAPPTIAIIGGGGTGATAVANLDQDGSVESITVTNPGINYTGPVTYTINNGASNGSGFVAGASTLGDNATGGLTKIGSGSLTLAGVNTFTGETDIQEGTLALNASGSILNSMGVSIAAGAELDTTAQAFTMLASQPFTFDIDPAGVGSAGLLDAASLDMTNGVVVFNLLGSLDDSSYVLANYSTLIGASFASATAPTGYFIDYSFGGNQIALVQNAVLIPESSTLLLAALGFVGLAFTRRRRN